MTKAEKLRALREDLDRECPGWRETLRRVAEAQCPGANGAVYKLRVQFKDGTVEELVLAADPEPTGEET